MKLLIAMCFVLAMACSTLGATENLHAVAVRSRRDMVEYSIHIVEELIKNLQNAAKEAMEAVTNFTNGLIKEAESIRDRVVQDIQTFRNRVTSAVDEVFERFASTSEAVKGCVESHRNQASNLFNETVSLTMSCVDDRIAEVGDLIEQLKTLATDAMTEASAAYDRIKTCTQDTNLLNAGACLGNEAINTEMASVNFLTQSTILVGRINLAIATLPGTFELCAGTTLVQTGLQTGRIIIELGTCSANVVYNYIIGKD